MKKLSILMLLSLMTFESSYSGPVYRDGKRPIRNNSAPEVKAGSDLVVTASGAGNSATIQLSGIARDRDNNIVTCQMWRNGAFVIAGSDDSVFRGSYSLPAGTHEFLMKATDSQGLFHSDTVVVTVKAPTVVTPPPPTNTAPVVNAGADISVTDMDKNNSEMVNISGTASDQENNISVYRLYQNGTLIFSGPNSSIFSQSLNLAVGTHVLKFEAVDAGGMIGSDSLDVVVNPGPVTVPSGTPPRANAGQDMTVTNTDPVLGVVSLNVSGSAAAGSNPIVSYVWKVNGVPFLKSSSSSILTTNKIHFPKANNLLELEVTDSAGLKGSDSAIIDVKPGLTDMKWYFSNNVIPGVISISAGGDRVFIDNNNDGLEPVRMIGSVNSINPIAYIKWMSRGKILAEGSSADILTRTFNFPPGRHGIDLTVTDSLGNVLTDKFTAAVSKPVVEQVSRIPSGYDVNSYLSSEGEVSPIMWKEESSFRFRCKPSHISYDDPIVKPGEPGATHMHLFFGNMKANAYSTYDSLRTSGDGSCDGGPNNRSAYWMPTVIDGTGKVVLPDLITIYYKRQPGSSRIPRGLRMVFGYDSRYPEKGHHGKWYCDAPGTTDGQKITDVGNCPASTVAGKNQIYARISAHNCWDGKNLDSPDHRSHMAPCDYSSGWGVCECPASHPVDIPAFTMLAAFSHNGYADFSTWKLSSDHQNPNDPTTPRLPGGSTLHADWFGAWDDSVMDMWMDGCMDQHLNCSGGSMGLLKRLKENAGFSWVTVPNRVDAPMKSTSGGTSGSTTGGTTTPPPPTEPTPQPPTSPTPAPGTAPSATLGPNLLTNAGFESGLTGWSAYNSTISSSSYAGTSAIRVAGTTDGYFNQRITVEPGATYRISAYAKQDPGAGGAQLYYAMKLPDGTDKVDRRYVFSTSYARLSLDVTIPAGITSFTVYFYTGAGSGGGTYVDDLSIQKVTPASNLPVLVAEGDSITAGGSYASYYGTNVSDINFSVSAVGGSGMASVNSRLSAVLAKKPASGQFVVTLLIGANDLGDPNLYASKIFAYTDQLRAAGAKVYVGTILPQASAAFNTNRKVANTLIRQAVGTRIDGVIDFAADSIMGADATALNPTYFPDQLHPSTLGQERMYWIYKPVIDKALGKNP